MANDMELKLKWGDKIVVFKRREDRHRSWSIWRLDMTGRANDDIELRRYIHGGRWESEFGEEESFGNDTAQEALDNIRIKIQALAVSIQSVLDYNK